MRLTSCIFLLLAVKISNAQLSLETVFSGTQLEDGDLWSITTKDYAVSIDRLAIHLDAITVQVMVYYRPGAADLTESDTWVQVFQDTITGQGMGNPTLLPSFDTPIEIPANSTYTIYPSSLGSSPKSFYHTTGSASVNTVFASDEMIDINEGYSLHFPLGAYQSPTRFNGVVYYSVLMPSARPSQAPTISLSPSRQPSMRPSLQPSGSPSVSKAPSSEPSLAPSVSREPTLVPSASARPSSKPSLSPSTSARPSSEPSLVPTKSASPTSGPSLAPSRSAQPSASLYPSESTVPSTTSAPSQSSYPSMSSVPSEPYQSGAPSGEPSAVHSRKPSTVHSREPSVEPSLTPSLSREPSRSKVLRDEPSFTPSLLLVSAGQSSEPNISPTNSVAPSASSVPSVISSYESTTMKPNVAPVADVPSIRPTMTAIEETTEPSSAVSVAVTRTSSLTPSPSALPSRAFATSAPSDIDNSSLKEDAPSISPSISTLPSNSLSDSPSQSKNSTSHTTASNTPTLAPTVSWSPSALEERLLPRHKGPSSSSSERSLDVITAVFVVYICLITYYFVIV